MENDDDAYTLDELFETARAMLAFASEKRKEAGTMNFEELALPLRAAAGECEAEMLDVLREMVRLWEQGADPAPDPEPEPPEPEPQDSGHSRAVALLNRMSK